MVEDGRSHEERLIDIHHPQQPGIAVFALKQLKAGAPKKERHEVVAPLDAPGRPLEGCGPVAERGDD